MIEKAAITEIGVVRLLRYGYGGILFFLLVALIDPPYAGKVIDALGPVLSPLAALAIGAAIYVFHRHVVGELFVYRAVHYLHSNWWDWFGGHTVDPNWREWFGGRPKKCKWRDWWHWLRAHVGVDSTHTVAYLHAIGVERGQGREAYNTFRRHYFSEHGEKKTAEGLDIAHTELHMLWLTLYVTLPAGIYWGATDRLERAVVFLAVSAVVACAAFYAEVVQMQLETGMLKAAHREGELQPFLVEYDIQLESASETPKP